MNFDSVNYSFILQDFVFAMGAGFAAGGLSEFFAIFLSGGRIRSFLQDMLAAFVFAAVVFSYTVSFANYPDIRIYHLIGALFGFLSFDFKYSEIFHRISEKIYKKLKNKMLCCAKTALSTICVLKQKTAKKTPAEQNVEKITDLKNSYNWVYNL